jgi:transposase
VPLALTLSAANAHDVISALPTVVDVPPVRGRRGRPRTRPDSLVAAKSYDSKDLRALLNWLGIHPLIPRRGDSSRGLGKARWPVERTFAWLHQFRRLRIRWANGLKSIKRSCTWSPPSSVIESMCQGFVRELGAQAPRGRDVVAMYRPTEFNGRRTNQREYAPTLATWSVQVRIAAGRTLTFRPQSKPALLDLLEPRHAREARSFPIHVVHL